VKFYLNFRGPPFFLKKDLSDSVKYCEGKMKRTPGKGSEIAFEMEI
jgi:hypothetical protein